MFTPPIPKQSFFERLPYDIRIIIYRHMEPLDLPPFTVGFRSTTAGFISSSRTAKRDMEDVAALQLAKFYHNFKTTFSNSTSLDIKLTEISQGSSLVQLRKVVIMLPFAALNQDNPQKFTWKRKVSVGLHPLFALNLDKIQIHFCGTENRPPGETLLDRGRVEVGMHSLLRNIGYMIEHVNRQETRVAYDTSTVSTYRSCLREICETYPGSHVRAKRLCLSWNLRNEFDAASVSRPCLLNGARHTQPPDGVDQTPNLVSFYHLSAEQSAMGEMGIVSEERWTSTPRVNFSVLLNARSTIQEYCSSDRLGGLVKSGLDGITKEDLEAWDVEIGALIFT